MQPNDLVDHPEGGRYREVFRSPTSVRREDKQFRSALTHIYFELRRGERSCFHRVGSDEVWNLYRGDGIRLYLWDGSAKLPRCVQVSADRNTFCHVVPAGIWQAAVPIGGDVLVGCSVAPGFEFSEFELLTDDTEEANALLAIEADLAELVAPSQSA